MVDSAELFEAISHPVRIKILRILEQKPSSFAALKRELNIDSSGNLDHHLKKLGPLIQVQADGLYGLADAGKEALLSISAIEVWKDDEKRKNRAHGRIPKYVFVICGLEVLIALLGLANYPPWFLLNPFAYLQVDVMIALLAFASVAGMLRRMSWGWKLMMLQSAVSFSNGVYGIIDMFWFLSYRQEVFFYASDLRALTLIPVVIVVILGLRPTVREFFGVKYSTAIPRRVKVSSMLAILSSVFNVFVAQRLYHSFGGGTPFLSFLMNLSGIAIAVGGVLILLRKNTAGALILIVTSSISVFIVPILIGSFIAGSLSLPASAGVVIGVISYLIPVVAGILALLSRPKLRS